MNLESLQWVPGVIVALLLAVPSFLYFRNGRKAKTLDYRVLDDDVQLLSSGADRIGEELEVRVAGRVLAGPRLFRVRFTNTGNHEILRSDFTEPIEIPAKVHKVEIASERVRAATRYDEFYPGFVSILPDLMNKGESFEVLYVIDSDDRPIVPRYRFVGETRAGRDVLVADRWRSHAVPLGCSLLLLAAGLVLLTAGFATVASALFGVATAGLLMSGISFLFDRVVAKDR